MLELAFQADRGRAEPVYRQLEAYLGGLVEAGRLGPGEKLPATRELAAALGLARNTVTQETFETLKKHFSEREIIDVTAMVAVERFYNGLAIPLGLEADGLCALQLGRAGVGG